jgi:hypothetical protein
MITEHTVEQAALELFAELGYRIANGPTTGPGEPAAERAYFSEGIRNRVSTGPIATSAGVLRNPSLLEKAAHSSVSATAGISGNCVRRRSKVLTVYRPVPSLRGTSASAAPRCGAQ